MENNTELEFEFEYGGFCHFLEIQILWQILVEFRFVLWLGLSLIFHCWSTLSDCVVQWPLQCYDTDFTLL